jgi:co-chaperonin GroES (HSP10)
MDSDSLDSMGTRVGNEVLDFVSDQETIRPLRDVIIVEPLEIDHGTSLAVVYRGKPLRGRVLAVGPGVYPRRYDGSKGKRTKSWLSKCFRPCDVKKGDVVDLGGGEIGGYLFQTVRWGTKEVVMCREADVCVIREAA